MIVVLESILSLNLEELSTLAAIITPILVILTYIWTSMESVRDREFTLRDRLHGTKMVADGFTVQISGIRTFKSSWWKYYFNKLFLFRIIGYTRVECFILQKQMPQEELWNNPVFNRFCEAHGFDVEHISTSTGNTDSTGVIFEQYTLDPQLVENFVKLLPEYLRIMAEEGYLQPAGPIGADRLEELENRFDNLNSS